VSKAESFAKNARIIHIDADVTEIAKNVRVDVSLTGDLKTTLPELAGLIRKNSHTEWKSRIKSWRKPDANDTEIFDSKNILEGFHSSLGRETIVVTDVGQHQMWTAQHWKFDLPEPL
jgi:acetolactate synthase-1/2/3 large subunit